MHSSIKVLIVDFVVVLFLVSVRLDRIHHAVKQTVKVLYMVLAIAQMVRQKPMKMNAVIHHLAIKFMVVILVLIPVKRLHHRIPLHTYRIARQHHHYGMKIIGSVDRQVLYCTLTMHDYCHFQAELQQHLIIRQPKI